MIGSRKVESGDFIVTIGEAWLLFGILNDSWIAKSMAFLFLIVGFLAHIWNVE